jgi:hypothetical protein
MGSITGASELNKRVDYFLPKNHCRNEPTKFCCPRKMSDVMPILRVTFETKLSARISPRQFRGCCPDTPIATEDGLLPISEIEVGDEVLA